eukprot:319953-Pleurochrysis_carterae.AAC.1
MRDGGPVDKFPASVALVVSDLRSLGGHPAISVVAKGLLASSGVGASGGGKHCGPRRRCGFGGSCGFTHSEQGGRRPVAEWVSAQSTLEVSL